MAIEELTGRDIYNDFMELFYNPEINKRKGLGLLNDDFQLLAAQVIFFSDGKPNIVRLNEEVSAKVKLKKGLDFQSKDFWPSKEDVISIHLNENQFLNCGHATLILLKDSYQLSFDLQYNKLVCEEHLNAANEFIKTSKYALDNNFLISFIDNSFSAIELLAKAELLLDTNRKVLGKTNHKTIKAEFNIKYNKSNINLISAPREIFNQLTDLRSKVRYLEGKVNVGNSRLNEIYVTIVKMYSDLNERVRD